VNLQEYSVFIASGEARYNLSAYLMCRSDKPDDQAYVTVRFVQQDGFHSLALSPWISETLFCSQFQYFLLVSESPIGKTVFYYVPKQDKIPATTRYIHVLIGANMTSSTSIGNQPNECYIDRIRFYIFKQLNGIQYSYFQKCPLIFDYFPLSFVDSTNSYNRKPKAVNQSENRPTYLMKKRHVQSTSPHSCFSPIDFLSKFKNKFICFI
jgi:hypothetical protein